MFDPHHLNVIIFPGSEKKTKLPFCSESCYLSISSTYDCTQNQGNQFVIFIDIGHIYAKIQKEKCSATIPYTKETVL
jgi:hypothetical protein